MQTLPPPKPIRPVGHSCEAATVRNAPIALWRVAEAFLHTLHNLFGAPEDVAFRHTLTRRPYRLLLSWIRVGEAMLRRLLLIEAAALPKPNTRPILWPARKKRARRIMEFFDDKPEDWRVSFRCFASSPARSGRSAERRSRKAKGRLAPSDRFALSSPARGGGSKFHSVWPLAERYEALIRVFNDPTGYAKRLAKHLYARATVALRSLLRETREAPHRIDLYDQFVQRCDVAEQHFLNTS